MAAQTCPNKIFLVLNLDIIVFFAKFSKLENLTTSTPTHLLGQGCQFEGADFKYDNRLLKMLAQKYPNEAYLVQNLDIIIYSRNFAN